MSVFARFDCGYYHDDTAGNTLRCPDPSQHVAPTTGSTDADRARHFSECDCHDSWDQCPCAEAGHSAGCSCCGTGICGPLPVPTLGSDRARLADFLDGMASDALGHAYTVTLDDAAACREAARLLRMAEDGIAAREAVERVREVHDEHDCGCLGGRCSNCPNGRFCNGCGEPAPCATIRALDSES